MPSGSIPGFGEPGGRVATLSQSLAVAGVFALEFSREFTTFAWEVSGGTPTARQVLVGFATQDPSSKVNPAGAQEGIDVSVFSSIRDMDRSTRWVFVYVLTAVAGATINVVGAEGSPIPSGGGGGAAGGAVTLTPTAITQSVNEDQTVVASAQVLAANANRKRFSIRNVGDGTVHLQFQAGAATADDYILQPGDAYEQEGPFIYTGEIRGFEGTASTIVPNVRKLEFD